MLRSSPTQIPEHTLEHRQVHQPVLFENDLVSHVRGYRIVHTGLAFVKGAIQWWDELLYLF